jgi:uncharacterized membrane protein
MQWTDLVGHLNLSAVFTHTVFKSELIGLIFAATSAFHIVMWWSVTIGGIPIRNRIYWSLKRLGYTLQFAITHMCMHAHTNTPTQTHTHTHTGVNRDIFTC